MSWADNPGLRVNKLWNALRGRIQRCRHRGRKKRTEQRRRKMNAPLYAMAERTEAVRNVHISKRTPAWEAVTDYRSLCYELEFELQRYQHANSAAIQWPLFLLSFAALAGLILLPEAFARWACIIGLTAQPFWLHSTWHARQYGIHALAWLYVGVYAVGIAVR